ncbi:MAG: GGDEF domain-containing phosphodiesterase [Sphaerochaetaceae bacterium]|nr:GGDEF domain-containing phosphodiesterase [Sphaerochaetaceae bacterium]
MLFDYSYNITALIFISILAIYYHISPIFPNRSNLLFSGILLEGTLSVFLDILTFYCLNNKVNIYVNYTVNILFFLSQWIIPFLLFKYLIVLTKTESKIGPITSILPILIVVINYSLLLTTPITKLIFYFDNDMNYIHGILFEPVVGTQFFLLLWCAFFSIKNRKDLTLNQIIIVPLFILISVTATIIQIIYPSISISSTSIAFAIFLMYLTLLKPNEYIDTMTNVYNRMAFNEYIYSFITKKIPFSFIVIDNVNTTKINNLISENFGNIVIKNVATALIEASDKSSIFRIEGDRFIIITKKQKKQESILNKLKQTFPTTVTYQDINIEANIHIAHSDILTDVKSTSEVIDLINFICKKSKDEKTPTSLHLENINEYRYIKSRNDAIIYAIENEEIELKLQPIYNTKSQQFNTAEALCRINSNQFGYISPSIFIPFAEKQGIISQLSFTMIKKVCKFLSSNKLPDSFKSISINLSVIDCLDPTFPHKVINLIRQYDIDKTMISFEVTESTASIAPQLEKTMNILSNEGISFSMDDFGTGYANLDSVLRLPFSTAKIDRALLLLAQEKDSYKVMISSLINMIKELDLEIVVEGIEDLNQIKFLSELKVDYYQGYYFSKPITTNEFINFLYLNRNKTI